MLGLEWTAAYWRLPQKPLSCCNWLGVIFSSGWFLLAFGISMGPILFTYLPWFVLIEKSGSCSTSKAVNLKRLYSLEPKGKVFWSSSRAFSKWWLPPPIPSSTWVPRIPSNWFGFLGFLRRKRQLSRGWAWNPTLEFFPKFLIEKKWRVYSAVGISL